MCGQKQKLTIIDHRPARTGFAAADPCLVVVLGIAQRDCEQRGLVSPQEGRPDILPLQSWGRSVSRAAMRINIPVIFVSGGPMEAGKVTWNENGGKIDLVSPMIAAGDLNISDSELKKLEVSACPTCGSCSGMFTANSMNCLTEALGLSLPGNGSTLATHMARKSLFLEITFSRI